MAINSITGSFLTELFKQAAENSNKKTQKSDNTIHFTKPLFSDPTMAGSYEEMEYDIQHPERALFDRSENYKGSINDKKAEYKITPKLFGGDAIEGSVGKKEIDLNADTSWDNKSATIKGTYDNKEIELTVKKEFGGLTIKGKNTNLTISKKALLSDDREANGSFGYDKELFPIIETYIIQNMDDPEKNIFASK